MKAHHYIKRIEKAQGQFLSHTGRGVSEQYITALHLMDFGRQGKGWRERTMMDINEAAEWLASGKAIRVAINSQHTSLQVFVDPANLDGVGR